ncbi:MAG: redoxin domain-containing protein [Desulfobacteraceae bacterium]|nr:redoxin domain-containing protein [Desulfobacteraceae bacterium]
MVALAVFIQNPGAAVGENLAAQMDFTLAVPQKNTLKKYLGLSNTKTFSLEQIQAEVVIIEIFSMYCPICQREAKKVNTLFALIKNNPSWNKKVKLIGIGAGNSKFEVDHFKETYSIEFPLFSDGDFIIHKKIGEVRTPHFFGLNLKGQGGFEVFYSKSGEINDPSSFLENVLKQAKIEGLP